MVRSLVEYCCPLWHPTKSKISDIQELESVQKIFTARIAGLQDMHYWDRLVHLSLMSLQRRRERFIILHMWKILHKKTSNDLDVQFVVRPRFGNLAIIPSKRRASSAANQSLFDNSFAVQGPKLWNAIPYHLNVTKDLEHFKDQLTKFMLSLPDKPPIRGYTPPNSNSLLCWRNERGFSSLWGGQKIWWPCQILTKLHIGHIGRSSWTYNLVPLAYGVCPAAANIGSISATVANADHGYEVFRRE